MRFIHCSDIHLGKTLSKNDIRYKDYFNAFEFVANEAVKREARVLVIAGDLFHSGSIKPSTLSDAVEILKILKDNSIEVIAIEGNHDWFNRRKDESWLLYLSKQGYLKLLRPSEDFINGEVYFEPFNKELGYGGFIYIEGFTFYGFGYWGFSAENQLERAIKNISKKADVGILHAGVWEQNFIDIGRVTREQFRPLSKKFRYMALGHGHTRYKVDDEKGDIFAYNPGSLEVVNQQEADKKECGLCYIVDINKDTFNVSPIEVPRRPYLNINIDVEGEDSIENSYDKIKQNLLEKKESLKLSMAPIIMLEITGKVGFNPIELDISQCKNIVGNIFEPIVCQVFNRTSLLRHTGRYKSNVKNIEDVFREVIMEIINENSQYKYKSREITDIIYNIHKRVNSLEENFDEDILNYIHNQRLLLENIEVDNE